MRLDPHRGARSRVMHLVSIVPARGTPQPDQRWLVSVQRADGATVNYTRTGGAPMEHSHEGAAIGGDGCAVRVVPLPMTEAA